MEVDRILQSSRGKCTIVTDNLWYGKYLTRQISEMISSLPSHLFHLRCISSSSFSIELQADWQVEYTEDYATLYEGVPGAAAGHVVAASSYFDR